MIRVTMKIYLIASILLMGFGLGQAEGADHDDTLGKRWSEVYKTEPEKLDKVWGCYRNQYNIAIYDKNTKASAVCDCYYKNYPDKERSRASEERLINSMGETITLSIENDGCSGDYPYMYDFNEYSDVSNEDFYKMTGAINPESRANATTATDADTMTVRNSRAASGEDSICRRNGHVPDNLDWRALGKVTAVRNQKQCGSCWAFAALGSIESSYLVRNASDNRFMDFSDQIVNDCARKDGCHGGTSLDAFGYVYKNGLISEKYKPYTATDNGCAWMPPKKITGRIRDYCIRSKFSYGHGLSPEKLSDKDIMKAVAIYGGVYAVMNANPWALRNYCGGVIKAYQCNKNINHAIVIVGYTDHYWIIKNSWGKDFGDNGYMYIERHKNACGINTEIAYAVLYEGDKNYYGDKF